jgi:deoxyribodipyrimidine photolyase-related protein
MKQLTLILGNQLFSEWTSKSEWKLGKNDEVLMIEDLKVASMHRYHRMRLLHTFVCMREFRDHLIDTGVTVSYFELPESEPISFQERILKVLGQRRKIRMVEIPDRTFRNAFEKFCKRNEIELEVLSSPQFLCSTIEFENYLSKSKKPFMKTFYERERKRLKILVDRDGNPDGGKWSFDTENRKKFPKNYREPPCISISPSRHEAPVTKLIEKKFPGFPGELGTLYLPYERKQALQWLKEFVSSRLDDFGPYEDAISGHVELANHSLLAPLINIGILGPAEVIEMVLEQYRKKKASLASVEGFVRQVIGWREFVKGIDHGYGSQQAQANFFDHHRKLADCWYDGSTGLPPLDDAIRKVNKLGYLHHIERLMVVSNLMLLCEIDPKESYRWFMEMFLDSYEWVMGPNVFGMGQMSDGGIFATKPYISGSNYILKMSDYQKGPWCEIWDGLYWSFIDRHRGFFSKNPRLSMMVRLLDRMPEAKKKSLFKAAADFKKRVSKESGAY